MRLPLRWIVLCAACLPLIALSGGAPLVAAARQASDWEMLAAPAGPITRLWALADGTLVAAQGQTDLFVSIDLGDDWQIIPPPVDGWTLMPDPLDPATAYGAASGGLFKTIDGGTTWNLIRPSAAPITSTNVADIRLAISPADHAVLYAAEPLAREPSSIVRSTDGGATWVKATDISRAGSPCSTQVSVLAPHPTDAARVFSDFGCYAGRNFGHHVQQSFDQGSTWSSIFRDGQGLLPGRLIGGGGADPQRFYLTTSPFMGGSAARLYRSDDDAMTWTEVLEASDPRSTAFGGLAYDPTQPDTVFVGTGRTPNPDDAGVRVTFDGGLSWAFAGSQNIGWVNDLGRTPDGTLFAATNEGIWRLLPGW